jgi:hypothetical protein
LHTIERLCGQREESVFSAPAGFDPPHVNRNLNILLGSLAKVLDATKDEYDPVRYSKKYPSRNNAFAAGLERSEASADAMKGALENIESQAQKVGIKLGRSKPSR